MCKFKSAIVLKNGDILHNGYTDSHEDLMENFKVKDNNPFLQNFVRIEFSSDKIENLMDVNSYVLKIDEDSTLEWFEEIKESVIERMKDIVSSLFVNQDEDIIIGRSVIKYYSSFNAFSSQSFKLFKIMHFHNFGKNPIFCGSH